MGRASGAFRFTATRRGAVLLQAMVVVTLVAVIAAAAMWQQWRVVEVESAQRTRQQAGLMLDGGVDYARLILHLDARGTAGATVGVDHLDEPWALPLQETRLSTFIDGQGGDSGGELAAQTFITGNLSDMHARLNVRNLGDADQVVRERAKAQFGRLFERLGLPLSELDVLARQAERAWQASGDAASAATDAPLPPRNTAQLVWLGLSPQTVDRLEPYVTVLPMRTRININTATAEVLQASSGALDHAQAQKLVQARRGQHFASVSAANDVLGVQALTAEDHAINSHYFEVNGWVRVGEAVVHERVLLRRDGRTVRTIWRERVPVPAVVQTGAAP